jgi:prevent-host-death family protein
MDTIGAFEAKTHLSSPLERVAKGESFTIARHSKPVARRVPARNVTRSGSRRRSAG